MNKAKKSLSAALVVLSLALPLASAAQADETSRDDEAVTLFYSDKYANGYYTVEGENFRTVVTVAPGIDEAGQPMQFINYLADGESAEYALGEYSAQAGKTKLVLKRSGNVIDASVVDVAAPANS